MLIKRALRISLSLVTMLLMNSTVFAQTNRVIGVISEDENLQIVDVVSEAGSINHYKVSHLNQRFKDDSLKSDRSFEYTLEERVLEKTASSSLIEWSFDKDIFQYQILAPEFFDSVDLEGLPLKIIFEMSHQGELLRIVNCQEVNAHIAKLYELNSNVAYLYKSPDCRKAKDFFKVMLYDAYSFFHGVSFSIEESIYLNINDTTSDFNYRWSMNGYKEIYATKQKPEDTYKLEEVYFEEYPQPIQEYISKIKKEYTEDEEQKINDFSNEFKETIESLINRMVEQGRKEGYPESYIDSLVTNLRENDTQGLKKYPFYDQFPSLRRYLIYDHENHRIDTALVEMNDKVIESTFKSNIRRQIKIERFN